MAFCFAYLAAGDFEKMLEHSQKALELNPRAVLIGRHQMIALAHLGRIEDAKAIARRYAAFAPKFAIRDYATDMRYLLADSVLDPMIEGLRRAGMPE